jgi:hypothetical protein
LGRKKRYCSLSRLILITINNQAKMEVENTEVASTVIASEANQADNVNET